MKLRLILFAPILLMFASCGAFADLSKGLSDGRQMLSDMNKTYQTVKPEIDESVDAAKKLYAEGKELFDGAKLMSGSASDLYAKGKVLLDEAKSVKAEISAVKAEAFKKADKDGDGNLDFYEKIVYMVLLAGGALEAARRKMKSIMGQITTVNDRVDHERSKRKASEAS